MPENPYQSPLTEPAAKANRKSWFVVALSLLAVPAAALAGGSVCTVSLYQDIASPLGGSVGIFLGLILSLGILSAAHAALPRTGRGPLFRGLDRAVKGFAIATPVALIAGYVLGVAAILNHGHGERDGAKLLFLTCGVVCFAIWSFGFWIGLRWGAAERK